MTARYGGADRISTKAKLEKELRVLGEVVAAARQRAGLKQAELANKLGLPASYLSKIENGTRRLDVIELVAIADAMGSNPAEIVSELQQELRKQPRS